METIEESNKYRNRNEKLMLNEINWWSNDESKDNLEYCLEILLLFNNFHKKSNLLKTINVVHNRWLLDKDIQDLCLRITNKFKKNKNDSETEDDEDDDEDSDSDSEAMCNIDHGEDVICRESNTSDESDSEGEFDFGDLED